MFLRNLNKTVFWKISFLCACSLFPILGFSEDAKMAKDAILFKDHSVTSLKAGTLQTGKSVKILDKSGFWVKVESNGQVGWVKLSDVQLANVVNSLDPLATGRNAAGNIVNTAGVRGLSPEELKNSQPNPSSVDIAIQNASKVKDVDVSNFITSAGLIPKSVIPSLHAVKTTMTGETQQIDQAADTQTNVAKKNSDVKKDRDNNENW